MDAILGGIIACAAAAVASPIVLRLIISTVVDTPNERSSHSEPTPRGGGIALVTGVAAGLAASQLFDSPVPETFVIATFLGALGLVEDIRGVGIPARLTLQTAAGATAAIILLADTHIPTWSVPLAGVAVIVWMVGFVNAFNFMDGINGISAAQLIVAGALWSAAGILSDAPTMTTLGTITAGAALGYLPWNFPRARFFIGDIGAYFGGTWLATGTVIGIRLGIHPVIMISPLVLYGADTTFTLLRRLRRREALRTAHRSHVYQRLVINGWSHSKTTSFFALSALLSAALSLVWLAESNALRGGGSVLMGAIVVTYLFAPRLWVESSTPPRRKSPL